MVRRTPILFLLGGCLLLFARGAGAAEFKVVPTFTLSEEYNDNIFQDTTDAQHDFVTRVQPGIAMNWQGKGLAGNAAYGLDYQHFARGTNSDHYNNNALLNANFSCFEDFLKLDLGDTYTRVSLNLTRDTVTESLVVNQTEQNVAYASPYLNWPLSGRSTLKTGYRFTDIRYGGSSGIDKDEHDAFAELTHEISTKLTANAGYDFVYTAAEPTSYHRNDIYAGFKYDLGNGTTMYGRVGNSWVNFSNGVSQSNRIWEARVSKDFSLLVASIGSKVLYTEDPSTLLTKVTSYDASLSKTLKRGGVTLVGSYSQYETTQPGVPDDQDQVLISIAGYYDLQSPLRIKSSFSGDHVSDGTGTGTNLPYHFVATAGLDYTMNAHTILSLNYSHISYRNEIGSATGAVEVNRVIVEMRLTP